MNPSKAVGEGANLVFTVVIFALIIGTVLGSSVFTALTIINVTALSNTYGEFVTAVVAFLAIGGTIIGILWFLKYAKGILSKKSGLGMSA